MFRPNRIGTPFVYQPDFTGDTSSFTVSDEPTAGALFGANIINAAPVLDFGRSELSWTGAARTLLASNRMAIAQQFTVTEPIDGDTVGVELLGGLEWQAATTAVAFTAFIAKIAAATSGVLAATTFAGPTFLPTTSLPNTGGVWRYVTAINTAIIRAPTKADVAGTYIHGFILTESSSTPTNHTFTHFSTQLSVRQLNDQQNVGYRDTRR